MVRAPHRRILSFCHRILTQSEQKLGIYKLCTVFFAQIVSNPCDFFQYPWRHWMLISNIRAWCRPKSMRTCWTVQFSILLPLHKILCPCRKEGNTFRKTWGMLRLSSDIRTAKRTRTSTSVRDYNAASADMQRERSTGNVIPSSPPPQMTAPGERHRAADAVGILLLCPYQSIRSDQQGVTLFKDHSKV